MTDLEILKKSLAHRTNEMLDDDINWWLIRDHLKLRDLMLPRLIEEKLKRNELHF